MGEFSPFHWLVVLAIVVLLFGGKKIPEVMRGLGEGIRNFKEGMQHSAGPGPAPAQTTQTTQVPPPAVAPPATPATEEKK
jgi:sec-independent protein translocase protein TatA